MPVIGYSANNTIGGVKIITWTNLANGDTGEPFVCPQFADKSVQISGTFGAGGTVVIEGSNFAAGTAYATLNDPQGNILSFTTAKIEQVLENTFLIRPNVTGGDGTTSLTVTLMVATPTEYSNFVENTV